MRNLLIIMSLVAVSCTTKTTGGYDVPEISPGIDYAEQPSVPMYEQMLLTGDVSAVIDYMLYDSGDYVISKYKEELGGTHRFEEYLYDANGFPQIAFSFDPEFEISAQLYFSDFDSHGNFRRLRVDYRTLSDYTVFRTIEYR